MFSLQDLLQEHGHTVIPFSTQHTGNHPTPYAEYFPGRVNFEGPGIKDLLNYIHHPMARRCLERLLDVHQIDLAHLHIYYGQLTTAILKPLKSRGIPIVQTLHEYKLVCPTYQLISHGEICEDCGRGQFWHAAVNRCNRGSIARSLLSTVESYVSRWRGALSDIDHFVAVSDFLRNKMIDFGVPEDKITTVHNFMDVSGIQPNYSAGSYLLYFGRIEHVKGVGILLQAASACRETPLYIVGEGTARAELENLAKELQLDHVKFLGYKSGDELQGLIAGCFATVVPSEWYETFGLTIIESFAHGKPVIASRIGGMTEVVTDGVDGFLIEPGSATELAEKIGWLEVHPEQSVAMGKAGRNKVETEFNPDVHYHKIIDVYSRLEPKFQRV